MMSRSLLRTLAVSCALGLALVGGAADAQDAAKPQDAPAPTPLALGATAPMTDVKMKNVDGKEVSIAEAKGTKGTLVVFSCNACPWVKKWENRIAALGNAYAKKGVGVIVINSNDPGKNPEDGYNVMVTRAKQKNFKFAYAEDATSDVARAFGASRTPEAFLFDAEGKLVYHGTIDDNADNAKAVKNKYLENALAAVAAGKAVPVAETKALGCGIKFRGQKAS